MERHQHKHGQLKASGKFGYKKPEKLASVTIVGKSATKFKHARVNNKSYTLTHHDNSVVLENVSISLTKSFTSLTRLQSYLACSGSHVELGRVLLEFADLAGQLVFQPGYPLQLLGILSTLFLE